MESRINYVKAAPGARDALLHLSEYVHQSGLEESLLGLVFLRASQINRCAFCIDMHWKDLRAMGQSEETLYMLNAWRESPGYTERERAALGWTEAVTLVTEGHVPDEVYDAGDCGNQQLESHECRLPDAGGPLSRARQNPQGRRTGGAGVGALLTACAPGKSDYRGRR